MESMVDYLPQYIEVHRRYLSPRSLKEYVSDIRILGQLNISLEEITPVILTDFLVKMPWSNRLTNRRLSAYRSFFNFLVEREVIEENPALKVKRFRIEKTVFPSFYTAEEMNTIRRASYNYLVSAIIETFYSTGIRMSELLTASVGGLELTKWLLRVMGKGSKERYVRFSKTCSAILEHYLLHWRDIKAKGEEQALFVSNSGKRLTQGQLYYIMTKLSKATGIHVHPHGFRHTFASDALDRGLKLKQVQELLGHKDTSTTSIYTHLVKEIGDEYDKAFP